ncbi:MAG: hypothetical protein NDJ94_09825 [Vicinamibacteria bacterium]|nr:hypothetical protein [Vicinamibacteria bacterium]
MTLERLVFVHLMKSAGSYVERYLHDHVLRLRGYEFHNSWTRLGRDYTPDELDDIRRGAGRRAYVHNHVGNWPAAVLARFVEDGWTTFTFARHPGDQWCSHYHYARKRGWLAALSSSLDQHLARAFDDRLPFPPRRNVDLPDYWESIHHVAVFTDASFARFLGRLDHAYSPEARVNVGQNLGYEHYLRTGEIRPATHELLLASTRWTRYQRLLARETAAGDTQAAMPVPGTRP